MHRSPAFARLRRLRGVASVVVLGVLCRALIPAGFMPAAIGAGGPVAVCHGGLAGEFFRRSEASRGGESTAALHSAGHVAYGPHADDVAHAGHGAHGGDVGHDSPVGHADPAGPAAPAPAADHEGWEHCPFGAAFGVALLAGDIAPELPVPEGSLEVVEPSIPAPFRPSSSYRARAPPSSATHA